MVSEDQWDWMQVLPPGLAWIVGPADWRIVADLLSHPPAIDVGETPDAEYSAENYHRRGNNRA